MDISRRHLFRGALVATGGAAVMVAGLGATTAAAMVSPKAVNYQNTPKGAAQCDNCVQWKPPAACKVVEGPISPSGWCAVYAPKPKS
jgi:hypothetical protein